MAMLASNQNIFGDDPRFYSYDCGTNFYSIKDLGVPLTQKLEFEIDPVSQMHLGVASHNTVDSLQGHLTEEARIYLGDRMECPIRAQLTSVQNIFPRGHDPEDHSVSQFLDVLSNQEITRRDNYLFFPSKIFERESVIPVVLALRLQHSP